MSRQKQISVDREFDPEKFINISDVITPSNQLLKNTAFNKMSEAESSFNEVNALAKGYIAQTQLIAGYKLRLNTMVKNELYNHGLLEIRSEFDELTGKRSFRYIQPAIKLTEEEIESCKHDSPAQTKINENKLLQKKEQEYEDRLREVSVQISNRRAFQILKLAIAKMDKTKNELLFESSKIFDGTELWDWCMRTEGMSEVAALTFMGYMNPAKMITDKMTGEVRPISISEMWSYAALIPGAKLRRGQQSHSNPMLKGRIMGVIVPNIIRHTDPYYYTIYKYKKDYYRARPDLVAIRDGFARKRPMTERINGKSIQVETLRILNKNDKEYGKIKLGWNAWTDTLARFTLSKILVSHAFQIIKESVGMDFPLDKFLHSNYLPIKPKPVNMDMKSGEYRVQLRKITDQYRVNLFKIIDNLKAKWEEDKTHHKEVYSRYLRHAELIT